MDYIQKYISRLNIQGVTVQDSQINKSKQIAKEQILNSPTRSNVNLNLDNTTTYPCIINDVDTFKKRKFIFTPDTVIDIGSYITHGQFTYLAVERDTDIISPQVVGELCNNQFPIDATVTKTLVGYDEFGRPRYSEQETKVYVPCIIQSQYSKSTEVNQFMIPEGKLEIRLRYQMTNHTVKDFEFELYGQKYKIMDIDLTNVILNSGFMTIIAEKVV